jgi:ketosteroid isomerase-like protein
MSVENVALARRAILGWNERGVDAIVESLNPAVEWQPPRESMEPGTYRGHDGVRDYFGRLREIFEDARVQLIDGKVTHVTTFVDKQEARRVAGLPA